MNDDRTGPPEALPYFATRLEHDVRREKLWTHLTRYLSRYVARDAAVLELGAGYCYFINSVAGVRKVAVDISPEMLRWKAPEVEGYVGDAATFLKEASESQFDVIMVSNFFEHFTWPELEVLITNIVRVLRPGGRLVVIQPNFRLAAGRYFDDYTHRTIFTDVSLTDWLRSSGLTILHVEPGFLPLTVKSRFGGLSCLIPLYLASPIRPLAGQMLAVAERQR